MWILSGPMDNGGSISTWPEVSWWLDDKAWQDGFHDGADPLVLTGQTQERPLDDGHGFDGFFVEGGLWDPMLGIQGPLDELAVGNGSGGDIAADAVVVEPRTLRRDEDSFFGRDATQLNNVGIQEAAPKATVGTATEILALNGAARAPVSQGTTLQAVQSEASLSEGESARSLAAERSWFTEMRQWMDGLDASVDDEHDSSECIFITPSLSVKDRIRIHFMAMCCGLSRLSIGKGKQKQVLLSPFPILPGRQPAHTDQQGHSRFRSGKTKDLQLNPCVIYICQKTAQERFPLSVLSGLPQFSSISDTPATIHAQRKEDDGWYDLYGTRIEFSTAMDALAAKRELEERSLANMGVAEGFEVHYAIESGNGSPDFISTCQFTAVQARLSQGVNSNALTSTRPSFAEVSTQADPSRCFSAASMQSYAGSRYSRASSMSKKRRYERVDAGYECSDCHTLFDRQCDRDKHWKNVHGERQHRCQICSDKTFVYEKDLRRHMLNVHKGEELVGDGSASPNAGVVRGFSPKGPNPAVCSRLSSSILSPIPKVKPAAVATKKKQPMFTLGSSSSETVSSLESLKPTLSSDLQRTATGGIGARKQASFTVPTLQQASELDEYGTSESAMDDDDDDSSDWEDPGDDEDTGIEAFQRVDSRPKLNFKSALANYNTPKGGSTVPGAAMRSSPTSGPSFTATANHPSITTVSDGQVQPVMPGSSSAGVAQLPPSPRTTRRNMLTAELTDELREDLKKAKGNKSALKRRHTAQDLSQLGQGHQFCAPSWGDPLKPGDGSFNTNWGEYHAKGW
jgi:DNA-directed RNA polymerase subunit RPC12/RpoP